MKIKITCPHCNQLHENFIYTTTEVMEIFSIDRSTVYRWEKMGLLFPAKTPGAMVNFFTKENLIEVIGKISRKEVFLKQVYIRHVSEYLEKLNQFTYEI